MGLCSIMSVSPLALLLWVLFSQEMKNTGTESPRLIWVITPRCSYWTMLHYSVWQINDTPVTHRQTTPWYLPHCRIVYNISKSLWTANTWVTQSIQVPQISSFIFQIYTGCFVHHSVLEKSWQDKSLLPFPLIIIKIKILKKSTSKFIPGFLTCAHVSLVCSNHCFVFLEQQMGMVQCSPTTSTCTPLRSDPPRDAFLWEAPSWDHDMQSGVLSSLISCRWIFL